MRLLLPLLALLIAGNAPGATSRETISWPQGSDLRATRTRIGAFTVTLEAARDRADPDLRRVTLTAAMRGRAPIRVAGAPSLFASARLMAGRWGDGRPYLLFQTSTGGSHCCAVVQLILPEGRRLRAIDVGAFDGEFIAPPTDVDGDGAVDFVVRDDRFDHAFASHAGSRAPPRIWNIVRGRAVDVSAAPRYRPLFVAAMNEERADCLAGGAEANGACAAYVAAAARAGSFDRAWREMLPAYERAPAFSLARGCRIRAPFGACPQEHGIDYPDFPSALRPFLTATGYLPGR